jgi:hypothetical protein
MACLAGAIKSAIAAHLTQLHDVMSPRRVRARGLQIPTGRVP